MDDPVFIRLSKPVLEFPSVEGVASRAARRDARISANAVRESRAILVIPARLLGQFKSASVTEERLVGMSVSPDIGVCVTLRNGAFRSSPIRSAADWDRISKTCLAPCGSVNHLSTEGSSLARSFGQP